MLPIALELLGCSRDGTQTPVDAPPPFDPYTYTGSLGEWHDAQALPLISTFDFERHEDRMARYAQEEAKLTFQAGSPTTRVIPATNTNLTATEYTLTYQGAGTMPVYALASGYLHYLHDGKSTPNVLGGATPNAGEAILVLRPLSRVAADWRFYLPGNAPALAECAYLNLTIDFAALQDQIAKSSTLAYHKKIFKQKTGAAWSGADADWPAAYLDLFQEHPDVPIVVQGGKTIGATTSVETDVQRLSLFLRMGELWAGHIQAVTNFFTAFQRHYGLAGHPLIAKLRQCSVDACAVDFIQPTFPTSSGRLLIRTKSRLRSDFVTATAVANPDVHPLALDPDFDPMPRLIVRKPPAGEMPPFLAATLPADFGATRFKLSNPQGQTITIDGFDPAQVTVTAPAAADAAEPIFEFRAAPGLPEGETLLTAQVRANGVKIFDLQLALLDFRSFPIRFYRLSDRQPPATDIIHQADIDEAKLGEVLRYANEILGQQANTYIVPVEVDGAALQDSAYVGDLGNPIQSGDATRPGTNDLHALFAAPPTQTENIKVVFVWDAEGSGKGAAGLTTYPSNSPWALILVDTVYYPNGRSAAPVAYPAATLAKIMLHELGHWFARTFVEVKQGLPKCSNEAVHFGHEAVHASDTGCAGGDWAFFENLMESTTSAEPTGLFISAEQARFFNEKAALVLPG